MLSILAPKTDHAGKRHRDVHNAPRPRPWSGVNIRTQTRIPSMTSSVTRSWQSTPARQSAVGSSDYASQSSAQAAPRASQPRLPTSSLSVSRSTPKRPSSIGSSKASAPHWFDYWKPQEHDLPHLTKTPWEVERYKKNSTWRRPVAEIELPARVFQKLPREIYNCIVRQLEILHLRQDRACAACYLRDLHSLSLSSRAWDRAARLQMYHRVYLVGHDGDFQTHKTRNKAPSRLKLLRRTLRERHSIARLVRELHLPDYQVFYRHASIERGGILNSVASLIMACPSLERLLGFHVLFAQSFDRLSYALATRPRLQERVWLFSELDDGHSDKETTDEVNKYYLPTCDPTENFLNLNSGHPFLTTLVIHRSPGDCAPIPSFRAIIGTFQQLPRLQHLSISGLPVPSWTNLALNALPPRLRSLRLENLPGVSDKGLQKFVTSHLATELENLTFINLELSNLITITNILSGHLSKLQRFTIAQYRTPDLHSRSSMPDFSCPSLEYIHFEFRSQLGPPIDPFSIDSRKSTDFPFANSEPISCLATSLLATNIKEGAFPALRRIRIPHDPQGVIQALCKPRATALLPSDTSLFTRPIHKNGSHGYAFRVESHQAPNVRDNSCITYLSPHMDSAIGPLAFDFGPLSSTATPSRTRLAAQARILAARKLNPFTIRVYNPEGEVCIETTLGGYMGDVKSEITYDLNPDASRWPGNRDQSGPPQPEWITGIEDLTDERPAAHDRSREKKRSSCGHRAEGRVGRDTVRVEELF